MKFEAMRRIKGWKKIVVSGEGYQYKVNLKTGSIFIKGALCLRLNADECTQYILGVDSDYNFPWRGKNEDGIWGKKEISMLIQWRASEAGFSGV